jgi:hypothetical protein
MSDLSELGGFNANNVEPNQALEVLPAADYDVVIVGSELKETSSGNGGKYLKLELAIAVGQYQNRKLYDNLNIINPNAQAQQIARGTLSAICRAVGVMEPKRSEELHGKVLSAKVKIGKDQNGNPQNQIKGYGPRKSSPSAASQAVPAQQQQQPVASGDGASGKPW